MTALRSSIKKNAMGLFALQLVIKGFSMVLTFYLARQLGVSLYGLWANVLALIAIFGVFQGFGILSIVVKEIGQENSRARSYFGAALNVYGVSSMVIFLAVLISSWSLGYSQEKIFLAVLAGGSFLLMSPGLASQSVLYGMEKFLLYQVASGLGTLFYMALALIFVKFGYGVSGIFIALNIGYALTSAVLYWRTITLYGTPVMVGAIRLSKSLATLGFPLVLTNLLNEMILRADRILIDRSLGPSAVGYYHAAFNLVYLPREVIFLPLITAVVTRLCFSYSHDRNGFNWLYEKIHIILFLIALPIAGVCMVFPHQILTAFYGDQFDQSAGILPILVWILPFCFLIGLWQNVFIIQNRTKAIFWITCAGAFFNLLFNMIFLPLIGLFASPIAAVLTQVLMLSISYFLLKNENIFQFARRFPRILTASFLATLFLYVLKPEFPSGSVKFLFILAVVGMLVYALFFFVAGVLNKDEIELLKREIKSLSLPFSFGVS